MSSIFFPGFGGRVGKVGLLEGPDQNDPLELTWKWKTL